MTRKEFDRKYFMAISKSKKNEACLEYINFLETHKTCLTCKFMEFMDDELDNLLCTHEKHKTHHDPIGIIVDDDYYCTHYKLNPKVKEDAKLWMW